MKVNIYYGGRGLLDDPTLYVVNKMQEVLTELRVEVQRYNIYEDKNSISTLPQTIKDADGIIICSSFWMHAGFMEIRRRFRRLICSRSLCQQLTGSVRENLHLQMRGNFWEDCRAADYADM